MSRPRVWTGISLFFFFCLGTSVHASNYFGRVTFGGYFDAEQLSDSSSGVNSNNFSAFSSRFYFKDTDSGPYHLDATVDFRDKNDFFDKLDQANFRLTAINKFQAYQLNLQKPHEREGFYWTLGRFNFQEAGGEFTDGAEVGYRWNSAWRGGVFGGLDARRPDQAYVGFNSDSDIFGAYTTYQTTDSSWLRDTSWSNALVGQQVQGHLDRFYWYNNLVYQWAAPSQIVAMVYLDFVPTVYIQTGLLSYHQKLSSAWSSSLSLSSIDVLQYQRQQGLLEQLPSSPYREGALNLRREFHPSAFFDTNLIYGVRQLDGLHKFEFSMGPSFYRIGGPHFSAKGLLGGRKNFDANEEFIQLGGGYFSKDWEINLSLNYTQSQQLLGTTLHKFLNEIALSRYYSREWYGNFEVQQGHDEALSIWAAMFKLSYMFGQRSVAPVQEKAPMPLPPPPEGRL